MDWSKWTHCIKILVALLISVFLGEITSPLVNPVVLRESRFLRSGVKLLEEDASELSDLIPEGESKLSDLSADDLVFYFGWLRREKGKDPWGRPYRIIHEKRMGKPWFGVYSLGRDGISKSGGEDLDDLNSWDESAVNFYREELSRYLFWGFIKRTLVGFPFILIGVYLLYPWISALYRSVFCRSADFG